MTTTQRDIGRIRCYTAGVRASIITITAAFALSGCNRPCDATFSSSGDDAQTATLTWSAGKASEVTISYEGLGDPEPRDGVVSSSDGEHTATLWGLPALSEITYTFSSPEKTCTDVVTTEGLPAGLPAVTVPQWQPENADTWRYLTGVAMGEEGTIFILDREGQWRWHSFHDADLTVSAVELVDGELWYNSFDQDRANDIGAVHIRPLLEGEDAVTSIRTENAHHTFSRLPDGVVAVPSLDIQTWFDPDEGEKIDVVGDRILEVDQDGNATEIWSIWDHAEPEKHEAWNSGFYGEVGKDWTHANSVNYSEARDSYLFSLAHPDTIYEVNRSTGEVMNIFTPDSVVSGTVYNFQHDPNWTDDGTLLLISYPDGEPAMAIEYEVDGEGNLSEIWSYQRETRGATLLGQARRLDNGNTFLNFGGLGEMREVTADGSTVWQLNAGLGSWFGNVTLSDTLPTLP